MSAGWTEPTVILFATIIMKEGTIIADSLLSAPFTSITIGAPLHYSNLRIMYFLRKK